MPFGGRGARRKPEKEGGSLNEVKTTHDAVWRRESRHAPPKARKEANVRETGHDRQARRRLCGTLRTKECKYGFACPKRGLCDATNSHRVTKRGHDRGRQRSGPISEGGDLRRTAPRRRTCVRQEGARTRKSPLMEREHRCPERDRIFISHSLHTRYQPISQPYCRTERLN